MNIYLADCAECGWSAEKTTAPDARSAGYQHEDNTGHNVRDPLAENATKSGESVDE